MAAGSSSALGTRPRSPSRDEVHGGGRGHRRTASARQPSALSSQAVLPHQRPPAAATALTLSSLRWALFSHEGRGHCPQLEQPLGL